MKKGMSILGLALGLFTAAALAPVNNAVVTKAEDPAGNSVEAHDCNLSGTTEAIELAYDGTATGYYGVQAYAGLNGPGWFVGETASEADYGKGSHRIGSNYNDHRNNLELTFKFNSTVEGEALLKLRVKHNEFDSKAILNENGFESKIDLHFFLNEWTDDCSKDTPIPVTVRKGVNVYKIKMQDSYCSWWSSFSLGEITARHDVASVSNTDSYTTDSAITIPYWGQDTKIYSPLAYAKAEGPFLVLGDSFWRLEDGSQGHGIGSNKGDGRSNMKVTFSVNNLFAESKDAYFGFYIELNGDGFARANMSVNDGTPTEVNFDNLNPVKHNDCVCTSVPVTLASGVNKVELSFCETYSCWLKGFKLMPNYCEITHDYVSVNYDSPTVSAVTVNYNGGNSPVWSIQRYAGIEGGPWVSGDAVPAVCEGHKIGSNADKAPTIFTFKINSTKAITTNLVLYVEQYMEEQWAGENDAQANAETGFSYSVNGGAPVETSLFALRNRQKSACTDKTYIRGVELIEGVNTITITMVDHYKAWFIGFAVEEDYSVKSYDEITLADFTNVTGDFSAEPNGIGQNSFDAAANYGKHGSVDYVFKVENAGKYRLITKIMAGNGLANRVEVKINGEVQMFGDKPYFEAKTDLGWNGDSENNVVITLPAGKVTMTIGNALTRVNADKNAEVPEGTEGSVLVSNWWMHELRLQKKLPDYSEVNYRMYENIQGDMVINGNDFGLNAFDDAANYGKTGSVDYRFDVDRAGKYYVVLGIMEGNSLANRVGLKVNGVVQYNGDKPYFEADSSLGWGPFAINKFLVNMPAGEVTLTISNVLTRVNADKNAEVPEGTEGSVLVSNWWLDSVAIEALANKELVVDTSNAHTTFNLYRPFSAEGIVVKVVDHDNEDAETIIPATDYVVDSSAFNPNSKGSYTIKVTYDGMEATYTVTNAGTELVASEGATLEFDGENEATQSFFNSEILSEGTGDCEGRVAYLISTLPDQLGYKVGSNGAGEWENRQVTFKLHINSAVAGKYMLKLRIQSEWEDNPPFTVKVNDGEEYTTNFFFSFEDKPYQMIVDLVEGENVVTIRSSNQYKAWFSTWSVAPITYSAVGTEIMALNGARWGNDIIDCTNTSFENIWKETTEKRSISFAYNVATADDYELVMTTPTGTGKTAQILVDGVKACDAQLSNGVSRAHFHLDAGNHIITVFANGGASTAFSLHKVQLIKYVYATQLTLDLTGVTTQIDYDGILSYSTLKVTATYSDGTSRELTAAEFKVEVDPTFSTTKIGTYTFTVVLVADENVKATFTVTVNDADASLAVKEGAKTSFTVGEELPEDMKFIVTTATGESREVGLADVTITGFSTAEAGEDLEATVTYGELTTTFEYSVVAPEAPKKGCGGSVVVASTLISVISLAGVALIASKKREDK